MYIIALVVFWLTAELGDYDEEDHTLAFISEFRFMPNQSEEMEIEIYQKYQSLRYAKQLSLWLPLVNTPSGRVTSL